MYVSNDMISTLRAAAIDGQYRTIVLFLSTLLDEQDLNETPDWREGDDTPSLLQCRLDDVVSQQADNCLPGYEAIAVWEGVTYRALRQMYALSLGAIAARKKADWQRAAGKTATYRPFAALQGLVS